MSRRLAEEKADMLLEKTGMKPHKRKKLKR